MEQLQPDFATFAQIIATLFVALAIEAGRVAPRPLPRFRDRHPNPWEDPSEELVRLSRDLRVKEAELSNLWDAATARLSIWRKLGW